MSKMAIRVLFGQPIESYPQEYAPEVITAWSEFDADDYPERWEEIKKDALKDGYAKNFSAIKEIEIEVDQDKIREILVGTPAVSGEIVRTGPSVP